LHVRRRQPGRGCHSRLPPACPALFGCEDLPHAPKKSHPKTRHTTRSGSPPINACVAFFFSGLSYIPKSSLVFDPPSSISFTTSVPPSLLALTCVLSNFLSVFSTFTGVVKDFVVSPSVKPAFVPVT